jgi:hypothetical protein
MKPRVGVYLSEGMAARLSEAAKNPRATKSALVEAALDRFLGSDDAIADTATVAHHLAGLSRQLELDRNLRIANETAALHGRFHLAVTPLMPAGEQGAACALGAERFEEFATQVGRRADLRVSLIHETIDRGSATRTTPFTTTEGEPSGTGSTADEPGVQASSTASVSIAAVREDAATLGFQAVEAALFTDTGTCRGIEEGEGAVAPHRSAPSWLTAARQVAKDRVENRSLILRVFLPFVVGYYTAQVTENVYDSPTGRFLLVPQGTRLIGVYDSQVAFGQSRVLLVWTRLIMPNGRSIVLERQPGADTAGYSGLEDEVDNHWGALFRAALLSTLLGVGSELGSTSGTGSNSDVITALRRGSSDSLNQTGQKVVQQNLNIQPTLTVRPGFPVRVIVNRDLVLDPYKD